MTKTKSTIGAASNRKRKLSPMGAVTRNKLLDSAERLFADHGYDGTALRDIADDAGVRMGLCTYHFGKKETLFEEVIRRRSTLLTEERLNNFAAIDRNIPDAAEKVDRIIKAYFTPVFRYRFETSAQESAFIKLLSDLINNDKWSHIIDENFQATTKEFLEYCYGVFPKLDRDYIVNAYLALISSSLFICSHPDHFHQFKNGSKSRKQKIGRAIDDFWVMARLIFVSA